MKKTIHRLLKHIIFKLDNRNLKIEKYLCLFVFIRGFPYPLSSFLFPIFSLAG